MPSRRDQVEAYSFAAGRLRSALVRAEPDAPRPPLRRTPIGLIIGAVLALLALGGVAMLALLRPASSPGWQQPGTLIIEKETGNRFLLTEGRLHPVLNYASARLLLPRKFQTAAVSARDLAGIPHGGRVGIEGAPDLLPARPGGRTWLVCATSTTAADGRTTPHLTVRLDQPMGTALGAALVSGPDAGLYILHNGRRLKVTASWVIRALGYAAVPPVPVTSSWLDTVPAGPDLASITVTGRGSAGPGGARVGQVASSTLPGQPTQYFLVLAGGLVPLNETVVALILGDPQTRAAYGNDAVRTVPVDLATATVLPVPAWAQLPVLPPAVSLWAGRVLCLRLDTTVETATAPSATPSTDPATDGSSLVVLPAADADAPPIREPNTQAGPKVADGFAAPPSGGALVRTRPAPGAAGVGLYLVVETGVKYPLADDAAATALGFAPAAAVPVPATLLALLPTGPTLRVLGGDR